MSELKLNLADERPFYGELCERFDKTEKDGARLDLRYPYKIFAVDAQGEMRLTFIAFLLGFSALLAGLAGFIQFFAESEGRLVLTVVLLFFSSVPVFFAVISLLAYKRGKALAEQRRQAIENGLIYYAYITKCDVDRFVAPKAKNDLYKAKFTVAYLSKDKRYITHDVIDRKYKTDPGLYEGQRLGLCLYRDHAPVFLSECAVWGGEFIAPRKSGDEAKKDSAEYREIAAKLNAHRVSNDFFKLDTAEKYDIFGVPHGKWGALFMLIFVIPLLGIGVTLTVGLFPVGQRILPVGLFFIAFGAFLSGLMAYMLISTGRKMRGGRELASGGIVTYAYIGGYDQRYYTNTDSEGNTSRRVSYHVNYSYGTREGEIIDRTHIGDYSQGGGADKFLADYKEGDRITVIFNETAAYFLTKYSLIQEGGR
ncbi:MAG: hypothetical protein LBS99_07390 [Clostridiales bacterium]|jgi:hypothetical protein|nr:hypothetical protein [Clostridiales bacterium]